MANVMDSKPANYPLQMSCPLYGHVFHRTAQEIEGMKDILLCSVLGGLFYLSTLIRTYIATAVSMIAKYQSKEIPFHWKIIKNVVRYLIRTENYGVTLPK